YKKIADVLASNEFKEKNAYRVYQNMHHGWAGARADLEKEDNHREFTDCLVTCKLPSDLELNISLPAELSSARLGNRIARRQFSSEPIWSEGSILPTLIYPTVMSSSIPFTSEACLQIPAVESSYQPKGVYVSLGEFDQVYKVGEKSSLAIIGEHYLIPSVETDFTYSSALFISAVYDV
ncbi:14017_t:CDS:2, partial [Acaulospora colombiana]